MVSFFALSRKDFVHTSRYGENGWTLHLLRYGRHCLSDGLFGHEIWENCNKSALPLIKAQLKLRTYHVD